MSIAKGMTNREWVIHEPARCLHYLLSSVITDINEMRASFESTVSQLAEEDSDGETPYRFLNSVLKCFSSANPERNAMSAILYSRVFIRIIEYSNFLFKIYSFGDIEKC